MVNSKSKTMNKCELFKDIAAITWDVISRNHSRGNRLSEIGITKQTIISAIQDHVEDNRRFDVFAQIAKDEVNTGADIELYLQSQSGRFTRILLQAKIMEINNIFESLDRNSGSTGRKQYDSLINYSSLISARSCYLFYNGINGYTTTDTDCAGFFDERQFGCAILEATEIKRHCEINKTGRLGNINSPAPIGSPWRSLVCCGQNNINGLKSYSFNEIDLDTHFERIFLESTMIGFISGDERINESTIKKANDSIHESGWNPFARILITSNGTKMEKEGDFLKTIR